MEDTLDIWSRGLDFSSRACGLILSESPDIPTPCNFQFTESMQFSPTPTYIHGVQAHRTSICCTIAFYDAVRYSKMPPSFHLARLDGLALQLHLMELKRCISWPEGKSAGDDTAVVFGGSLKPSCPFFVTPIVILQFPEL